MPITSEQAAELLHEAVREQIEEVKRDYDLNEDQAIDLIHPILDRMLWEHQGFPFPEPDATEPSEEPDSSAP